MADFSSMSASSLEALTQQYRTITHNLANANTPGFKRSRTSFQQLLDSAAARAITPGTTGGPGGRLLANNAVDFQQGALTATGRNLDLAIEGDGFFVLETPEGPLYTRCGKFRANEEGQLVDGLGRLVAGKNGPIALPAAASTMDVAVGRDGQITAGGQSIGQLRIVRIDEPAALMPVGNGCFRAPASAEVRDADDVVIHQGFHESSNVSVVEELVSLISVTRLYEANLKTMNVQDETTKDLIRVANS